MKSSLSAICMKLKSQIDRQQRGGTEREGEREGPVVEGERDYLLSTLRYRYTSFRPSYFHVLVPE